MAINRYKNDVTNFDVGNYSTSEANNILLVEDDFNCATVFANFMKQNGLQVDICTTGTQAIKKINRKYKMVILDMQLADMNGMQVLGNLVANDVPPIMCWTGTSTTQDEILAWRSGMVIDFVFKPTPATSMLERIMYRITPGACVAPHKNNVINIRGLSLDLRQKTVRLNNIEVKLAPKEYALLECLARNVDATLCKKTIMSYLYQYGENTPHSKILDVLACKIREKINEVDCCYEWIITKWSIGFVINSNPPLRMQFVHLYWIMLKITLSMFVNTIENLYMLHPSLAIVHTMLICVV
jgi:two-component system OmpR family response regulator